MDIYLPIGTHRELKISRKITETGPFTGGGWKLIWHTTEGNGLATMVKVLQQKKAEPHFVIDHELGRVVQLVRLDEYARALMHPPGTPETNRANCIQIEICGFAKQADNWSEHSYRNLARLALLIKHRVPIPNRATHPFRINAARLTPNGFVKAAGWLGHEHVPNNDHYDPGALPARHIIRLMEKV